MNDRREIETRLGRFTIPPPGELARSRALAAGRESAGRLAAPDVWDRIWSSKPFRLAWALAVVVLAAGHAMLPRGSTTKDVAPRYVERMLRTEANDELVAGLVLPPVDRSTLPRWGGDVKERQDNGEMRNE